MQAMKLRMSASERLVDLGAIAELAGIRVNEDRILIGAMTRHADVASSATASMLRPSLCTERSAASNRSSSASSSGLRACDHDRRLPASRAVRRS